MKKVAILTINDNLNYGNRLQNYAVQEVLKKNGLKSETINNQKGNNRNSRNNECVKKVYC